MLGFFKKLLRPQALPLHAVVDPAIAQINVEARNKAIRLLDIRIENLYQELGYYAPAQPAVPSPNVSSPVPLSRPPSGHQALRPTLQALPSLGSRVNAVFWELEERVNVHTPPTRPGIPAPHSLSEFTSPRHRANLTALDTPVAPVAQIPVSTPRSQQRTRRSSRASDVATTPTQQNQLAGTIPLPSVTPSSQAGSIESGPQRLLSPLGSLRLEQLQSVASQPAERTPGPTTSGQPTRRDVSTNQSTLVAGGTYPGQERRSQTPRLLLNFAEVGRQQPVLFAELQDDSRLLVQLIEKVQFRVAAKVESCMDRVSKRRARGNLAHWAHMFQVVLFELGTLLYEHHQYLNGVDATSYYLKMQILETNIGQVAHRLAEMEAEAEYGPSHERLLLEVQNLVMESVGWLGRRT